MKKLIAIGLCLAYTSSLEAAIALRNVGTAVTGTAANLTLTEPASSADNDIEIAVLYVEGVAGPAVTAPSGWSNSFNGTSMQANITVGSDDFRLYFYWIRRSGAPALVWTFTSTFRAAFIVGYSGALASGDPWSFGSTAVRDDTTANSCPSTSGTTSDANEMLWWSCGNFIGGTSSTVPSSPAFTERFDAATAADLGGGEFAQAAAGATGTVSGGAYAGGAAGPTAVLMGGLRPFAAAGAVVCQPPFCGVIGQ